MFALAGIALIAATAIAVEGEGATCPSAADVLAALEMHLPGSTTAHPEGNQFRLRLASAAGGTEMRLYDFSGGLRLQRLLKPRAAVPGTPMAVECDALAEAAALIVQRHFAELPADEQRPPSASMAPAVPPARLSPPVRAAVLRVRARTGRPGFAAFGTEGAVGGDFRLGRSTFNLEGSLGIGIPGERTWRATAMRPAGAASWFEGWALVGVGPAWQWREHRLLLRAGLGLAAIRVEQARPRPTSARWAAEPWCTGEALYRFAASHRFFFEVGIGARMAFVRHQLTHRTSTGSDVLLETPRVFADISLGSGITF